jgi:hypothetical protein
MKKLKFSGRELAVLRAVNFSLGSTGSEIIERTNIEAGEIADIVNGLMDTGYLECTPPLQQMEAFAVFDTLFEINPAYSHDLKEALLR